MKIILRILIILMIGTLVSSTLYLTIENTSMASSFDSNPSFDQMPVTTTGDFSQPPTRPDENSNHNAVSLLRSLSEVGVFLVKLTGITLLVLLVQKVFEQVKKRRAVKPTLG